MYVILETREAVQQFQRMCRSMSNQGYDINEILSDMIEAVANGTPPDVFSRKYITYYIDSFSERDRIVLRDALNTLFVGIAIAVSMAVRDSTRAIIYGGIDDGDVIIKAS